MLSFIRKTHAAPRVVPRNGNNKPAIIPFMPYEQYKWLHGSILSISTHKVCDPTSYAAPLGEYSDATPRTNSGMNK
ncbi:MAG: hypothetical protein K2H49_05050 [Muribaculaceae bacterium]|nr:hypothetical protein [Muribaculaceae bacterium]